MTIPFWVQLSFYSGSIIAISSYSQSTIDPLLKDTYQTAYSAEDFNILQTILSLLLKMLS